MTDINRQIGEACNRAAAELPEGYLIHFVIERHGYAMKLTGPNNMDVRVDSFGIADEIDDLIELAKTEAGQ